MDIRVHLSFVASAALENTESGQDHQRTNSMSVDCVETHGERASMLQLPVAEDALDPCPPLKKARIVEASGAWGSKHTEHAYTAPLLPYEHPMPPFFNFQRPATAHRTMMMLPSLAAFVEPHLLPHGGCVARTEHHGSASLQSLLLGTRTSLTAGTLAPSSPTRAVFKKSEVPLAEFPSELLELIAEKLEPRDRFEFALTSRHIHTCSWPSNVWGKLAYALGADTFGVTSRDVYLTCLRRRNIEETSLKSIVLHTFYRTCLGCQRSPQGEERITGLSLCQTCLKTHPLLGVCGKSRARSEYLLDDADLCDLGHRSAILEYDWNLMLVHKVWYYRRALLKKAIRKYGSKQALEQALCAKQTLQPSPEETA
ncbi:hypothetical protein FVE85_8062 [Porphyridium purpureum]|uniref:F-box domain-containing protein n=1 Tax=Porphyridium purpureum TaxID=35688 RepID=A0A5J4YN15_PORPP|nr:hypothetical protein FVE85_8062 [Porphyridium purpureum]|eukprot:POR5109..scf295_9